jgi:hypothetical protein
MMMGVADPRPLSLLWLQNLTKPFHYLMHTYMIQLCDTNHHDSSFLCASVAVEQKYLKGTILVLSDLHLLIIIP